MNFLRTHLRWGVVALLFFTALLNNLDRMVLSVLAPTLKESLAFGDVEYSYVVAAFLAAYALGYTFCGKVLDRVGVKLGMMAALVFWSVAGMGHAAAVGWLSLAAFRFLLGLGESFNSPGGVKAIAEWIPRRERGLCMAVFSNGNVLGSIIAPPLVAFLSLHLGWRWAFGLTGGLGLLLWAVWRHVYHSPENHPRLTDEERAVIMADRTGGSRCCATAAETAAPHADAQERAPPVRSAMITARSSSVRRGWFSGEWYTCRHTAHSKRPSPPVRPNAHRQPRCSERNATSGGAMMEPSTLPFEKTAMQSPRSRRGIHSAIAFTPPGELKLSPSPSRKRQAASDSQPIATARPMPASDQNTSAPIIPSFTPTRSSTLPQNV